MLEILSSNGAPGASGEHTLFAKHTLFVWDKGYGEGTAAPTPRRFSSGGSGGGDISPHFDQVDERGTMMVTSVDSFGSKTHSITRYRWDGERFVDSAAK